MVRSEEFGSRFLFNLKSSYYRVFCFYFVPCTTLDKNSTRNSCYNRAKYNMYTIFTITRPALSHAAILSI